MDKNEFEKDLAHLLKMVEKDYIKEGQKKDAQKPFSIEWLIAKGDESFYYGELLALKMVQGMLANYD